MAVDAFRVMSRELQPKKNLHLVLQFTGDDYRASGLWRENRVRLAMVALCRENRAKWRSDILSTYCHDDDGALLKPSSLSCIF